jgi:hypothetical protein
VKADGDFSSLLAIVTVIVQKPKSSPSQTPGHAYTVILSEIKEIECSRVKRYTADNTQVSIE